MKDNLENNHCSECIPVAHASRRSRLAAVLAGILLCLSACAAPPPPPAAEAVQAAPVSGGEATAPGGNADACVEVFDPLRDYFPAKVNVQEAQGFSVSYHGHYKVVTVSQEGQRPVRYVLVQCGTPPPEGYAQSEIFNVPVRSILVMSTTYLPFLEQAGALDRITGIDDASFVSNETVLARIRSGEIAQVGTGSGVNVEKALMLQPDLILAYQSGVPEYDAFPRLLKANLKVALAAEQAESSPLGRAEWGKFIALFLNREAEAEAAFNRTAERYRALREKTIVLSYAPTVFFNAPYEGTWYMAGGKSYMAQLALDAGAAYLWADLPGTAPVALSFEKVYERAAPADFWLLSGFTQSADDLAAEDERFRRFAAFRDGKIYNNNARITAAGGNDYYESGAAHPDMILADLIKIFHPQMLPEHELFYYRALEPEAHDGG